MAGHAAVFTGQSHVPAAAFHAPASQSQPDKSAEDEAPGGHEPEQPPPPGAPMALIGDAWKEPAAHCVHTMSRVAVPASAKKAPLVLQAADPGAQPPPAPSGSQPAALHCPAGHAAEGDVQCCAATSAGPSRQASS